MEKTKLQWHPAFGAALRITLQDEMKYLEMHEEHLLSKKPLQMDILIIKKTQDIQIKKKIGMIFRKYNIIEYKSPEDSLSVNDFYKVYGYACIYQSNTDRVKEIDPEELTLTFACSHYPRKLLRHLETVRGMRAEYQGGGIYYLNYSANCYSTRDYSVGCSQAESPLGPFVKYAEPILVYRENEFSGPGHNHFFTDPDGKLYTTFHIHTDYDRPSGNRRACIAPVVFGPDGKMIIDVDGE